MSTRKRSNNHPVYSQFNQNPTTTRSAIIENLYIRVLTELATNRFKWTGFPDSIDVRFLEMTLFYQALSIFYFDKRYDKYFALRGGGTNWNNMMDNPVGFSVVGANFVGMNVSATKETKDAGIAIPIWANYVRMPDLDIVTIYAHKFAELDRTIEINSDNARQNKIVASSDNQRLTMRNINRMLDEGQNLLEVHGNIADMQFIQALDLGINPDLLDKLHILRTRLWNECMGLLGIDNANQDKKERLVEAEVDANQDQTSMTRYVNLNARRMACKLIKDNYGLDIKVDYYTDEERSNKLTTGKTNSEEEK